jgi:hypothetical protein
LLEVGPQILDLLRVGDAGERHLRARDLGLRAARLNWVGEVGPVRSAKPTPLGCIEPGGNLKDRIAKNSNEVVIGPA